LRAKGSERSERIVARHPPAKDAMARVEADLQEGMAQVRAAGEADRTALTPETISSERIKDKLPETEMSKSSLPIILPLAWSACRAM
jgi:hypothetical protein